MEGWYRLEVETRGRVTHTVWADSEEEARRFHDSGDMWTEGEVDHEIVTTKIEKVTYEGKNDDR